MAPSSYPFELVAEFGTLLARPDTMRIGSVMTTSALLELIANGEDSGVEFKRDDLQPQDLARELVAFANLAGGRVLLGVEDDGAITGIQRAEAAIQQWIAGVCRDKIRPELAPYISFVRGLPGDRTVAVIQVERGLTAHHLWHNQHHRWFLRIGNTCREPSQEELARLFQQRGHLRPEIQPVSGTSMADLDRRRLEEYFVAIRQQEAPDSGDDAGWTQLLLNTEFLHEGDEVIPATLAGLLLFGVRPSRYLPHAGIDATVFRGQEKYYDILDQARFRAPLVRLGSNGSAAPSAIRHDGVVEQAMLLLKRHLSREGLEPGEGARSVYWDYPPDALREVLVNALVHRDYLLTATAIEISIYSDRVEVVSPGRLPNGITPARMRAGCRAARNQLIKDAMADYRYREHLGMGIPRKVIRLMREHNHTEPEFVAGDEQLTVVLRKGTGASGPRA